MAKKLVPGSDAVIVNDNGDVDFGRIVKSRGRKRRFIIVTAAYTIQDTDENVICNSSSAFTVTILTATGSGQVFTIANINTGTVTVSKAGDTINRVASQTLAQDESITIQDVAANTWVIL